MCASPLAVYLCVVALPLINVPILEMPLQRDIHRHRHLWANVNYISCHSWPEGGSVQRCVDMAGLNSSV